MRIQITSKKCTAKFCTLLSMWVTSHNTFGLVSLWEKTGNGTVR